MAVTVLRDSNKRQALVTVLVALLLAGSALAQDAASDEWNGSLTAEIRHDGLVVELLRHVYVDIAPVALDIEVARNRSDILADAAKEHGTEGSVAGFDAEVDQQWAWHQQRAAVAIPENYRVGDYGYDLAALAAEEYRSENLNQSAQEIAASLEAADRARLISELLVGLSVLLIAIYLVTEIVARRSGPVPAGTDVEFVPRPWAGAAVAAFVAWSLLGALPWIQVHAANDATQADAEAARAAVRLTATTAGSTHVAGFALAAQRDVELVELRLLGREYAAEVADGSDLLDAEKVATAAYRQALDDQRTISRSMSEPLSSVTDADRLLVAIGDADVVDWQRLLREYQGVAGTANQRASDTNFLNVSILLAGLSLTLSTLAGSTPAAQRSVLLKGSPWVLVLVSIGLGTLASVP
jgi:hypothetical protein